MLNNFQPKKLEKIINFTSNKLSILSLCDIIGMQCYNDESCSYGYINTLMSHLKFKEYHELHKYFSIIYHIISINDSVAPQRVSNTISQRNPQIRLFVNEYIIVLKENTGAYMCFNYHIDFFIKVISKNLKIFNVNQTICRHELVKEQFVKNYPSFHFVENWLGTYPYPSTTKSVLIT